MAEIIEKWSILTMDEYKELDFILKGEYIKRYGRIFYQDRIQNGVFNKHRSPFPGSKTEQSTTAIKEEV